MAFDIKMIKALGDVTWTLRELLNNKAFKKDSEMLEEAFPSINTFIK